MHWILFSEAVERAVLNFEPFQLFLHTWIVDCFLGTYSINSENLFRGCWESSLNFQLVHMILINWIVSLGTHCLHCLFSHMMKILTWGSFWSYSTILGWLDCRLFLKHTWYALWNFVLEAVGILSLSTFFDQADKFLRHAWLGLSVFSFDWKFLLTAVFEVIQLFLDNWIADCLVWWWKTLAQGSWNFELVQLILDTWIIDWFVRHTRYALNSFFGGCWKGSFEFWAFPTFLAHLDCRLFFRHV